MKLRLDPAGLPTPTSPEEELRYTRRALWLIGGLLVLRLVYAAIAAVNPAGDEAYYWDWGRRPAAGYYSKPPFIAWLYAVVDFLGGGSLFGIRAAAAILGSLSLWLLYRLATALFDAATGWIALLIGALAPANAVLSFFLTIDAPLVACWTAALLLLWRQVSGQGGHRELLLLACVLGIGHLSKQMMMAFPALAVLFLALGPETRPLLRRAPLQLALWGSYLALLPPLVWNARNDWITFQHTSHHFETAAPEGGLGALLAKRAADFLAFAGSQLGVLGPVIGAVLFCVCLGALWRFRSASVPVRFLLVFASFPIAGMCLVALRQEMQPNWAAVFYIGGVVLTAAWYRGLVLPRLPPLAWRALFPVALAASALFALYFYAGGFLFSFAGLPGHKADPERRLRGHDTVAREFEAIRRSQADAEALFLVTLGHRDLASHLAFGLPDQPRLYHWHGGSEIRSQYDLWPDPLEDGLEGRDALLIVPNADRLPRVLARAFEGVENLGEFEVVFGYDRRTTYRVVRGISLRAWPDSRRAAKD